MINILYVTSTLKRTGPTNVMYNLIKELDRSNFTPIILTLSPEDSNFPTLHDDFLTLNVEIQSLELNRFAGFIYGSKRIRRFADKYNISVIHNYGFRGDLIISKKHFSDMQIITTINSNIFDDYTMLYGKIKGAIMAKLHVLSIKDKLAVGCSKFVADELSYRYGINLSVIYNGISKEKYTISSDEKKDEIKKQLGIPLKTLVFVFVGYLIFRKDPITVIDAFLKSSSSKDSVLIILGDGPLMDDCKSLVAKNKNILLVGNRPETLSYLSASDYYISSSFSEGLPTSVMEAMGCGLPVILSDIDPHRELTSDLIGWKYLFPIKDQSALKDKIDSIVKDDYNSLREMCRDVIENRINSALMTEQYCKLYLMKIC